jgi:hypothetical protein
MFGGEVIGIVRLTTHAQLTVQDPIYGDPLPIRVREHRCDTGETVTISLGDALWWTGDTVRWTPKTFLQVTPAIGRGVTWDVLLPRVG